MLPACKRIKKTLQLKILIVFFLFFFGISNISLALAATTQDPAAAVEGTATMGLAKVVETQLTNIKGGSVVSLSHDGKGAILSTTPYDPQIMGVVSRDAAILIDTTTGKNGVPVISDGIVYILVSTQQGNITRGDLITSSTIPGVAVKATTSGYVLGEALEDYDNPNPNQTDLIAADLNLHYFNSKPTLLGSLTDLLKYALLPTKDSPSPIWKYLVAAAVVLTSFILAYMTFGRTAAKGVEALGRNPSASRIIHLGIIFNVSIVVIIVLAGLTVAFLILKL
jgi:F0F1-type ATP synthase membrane subunit c/vacuolar-type H+-ATPase subunit K